MFTVEVIFKSENFLKDLERKQKRFPELMLIASQNIMKAYMAMIIDATPKPGDIDEANNAYYVRTGRLVGGWGKAAAGLGISAPFSNDEGSFDLGGANANGITITARNEVPYASAVEHIGSWLIPPNAPGGPRWSGGRHMVENARGNILGSGVITTEIEKQWRQI